MNRILTYSFLKTKLIVLLLLCFSVSFGQDITVDFEGKISNENVNLSEATVQVIQNGKVLTSFKTDKDGSYNVYLPLGGDYVISVSKTGFVKKYFNVSTSGIPPEKAKNKFPVLEADVDLFKFYEGVDYSLFDGPVNKYYYNSKKDNMEYDKEYLKEMIAAMKLVKKAEREAMLAALQKNKTKQLEIAKNSNQKAESDKLAEEKKKLEERLAFENELLKKLEAESKALAANKTEAKAPTTAVPNDFKLNIVVADPVETKKIIDKKIADLLAKYKPGVTEEQFTGEGIIIIRRTVVREQEAWVYEKKIFNWGGVSYFRDRQPITSSIFEQETAKGL